MPTSSRHDGCGFSGKCNVNAPTCSSSSYAKLQQQADKVSGSVFDKNGVTLMQVAVQVFWGKGWSARWQNLPADMVADEKPFQINLDASPGKQWCALREGVASACVFSFTCKMP